jgi:alpha-L-rhamnosidase
MMLELSRWGQGDLAYTLANRTDFPSWGFMIGNGATTVWERWDGYVKGRGFQDPGMNSFNHWALGSVAEWLWSSVVGLAPDEDAPGWRRFRVRPIPGGGLTWAKGEFEAPTGRIAVHWRTQGGRLVLNLTVPPNTQALVTLPGRPERTVGPGAHVLR